MQDVYDDIEECNPDRKRKILIVFDYMIADMISNKKLNQTVKETKHLEGKKLNISSVFITQSYFSVAKDVRLNCTHLFCYENSKQKRASAISI